MKYKVKLRESRLEVSGKSKQRVNKRVGSEEVARRKRVGSRERVRLENK
jgi:hypothetical protein